MTKTTPRRCRMPGMLLALAALAPTVSAQTSDAVFRSWEWDPEPHAVRAAALAGAVAAEAADGSSALLHPSGLSLLSEAALRASLRRVNAGDVGRDAAAARWSPGELALTLPLGLRWGVGAYYHATRRLSLTLEPDLLPEDSRDEGFLRVDAEESGVAVGYAASPRWRIGLRLGLAHLDLDAASTTFAADGASRSMATALDAVEPRVAASLLFAPDQRFQIGATWTSRVRWSGHLDAGDTPGPWALTVPARLAVGALYRPSGVVLFLAQWDRVGWAAVSDALSSTPGVFAPGSATELRLALELRPHHGEFGTWARPALRLGWHARSRGLLAYVADDPVQRARFPGAGHSHEWSVGAAAGAFELAWIAREPASTWLLGLRHAF